MRRHDHHGVSNHRQFPWIKDGVGHWRMYVSLGPNVSIWKKYIIVHTIPIMTSRHFNAFHINDPLRGQSARHRWISVSTKGQLCGCLIFPLLLIQINYWINNRVAGDLRCHETHVSLYIMQCVNTPILPDEHMSSIVCSVSTGARLELAHPSADWDIPTQARAVSRYQSDNSGSEWYMLEKGKEIGSAHMRRPSCRKCVMVVCVMVVCLKLRLRHITILVLFIHRHSQI